MDLTPEQIEAVGKAVVGVIAAFGAIVATLASAFAGYLSLRNRRDLHIAFDRVRQLNGEPLQYRHDPERRAQAATVVPTLPEDPTSRTGETL